VSGYDVSGRHHADFIAAMARAAPHMGEPCAHGSTTNVCRRCDCEAELARLRAANARLRAECDAGRALVRAVQARLGFAEIAPYRTTLDAARRAVDEAGDLR